jgi:glycosyltransferase involved in cell wall biosynthesis
MDKSRLTVAIIAKNAQKTIINALESAKQADEIIILDDHSDDQTVEIAKKYTDSVYSTNQPNFAAKRNEALEKVTTDWLLYLDSDEIISPELMGAIKRIVKDNKKAAYRIRRRNFFLGKEMYPDYVDRLFHKDLIKGWHGDVHESPIVNSKFKRLNLPIIHHTHTDITSMLTKTNHWSEFEADLRIRANHPPVAWWRLMRMTATELWHQFANLKVGRFGREGLFEGYFQMVDKLIVYTKLWEKQQK